MKLNEVTEEIKEKLYKAETVEEFMKVAGDCGIEITREEADQFYKGKKKLKKLSDDALETVTGAGGPPEDDDWTGRYCSNCGQYMRYSDCETRSESSGCGSSTNQFKCPSCGQWNDQ